MSKNTCYLNDTLMQFSKVTQLNTPISTNWNNTLSNLSRFFYYYNELEKLIKHIHKYHLHSSFHMSADMNNKKTGESTLAEDLNHHNYNLDSMNELYSNTDINDDKIIYGHDFIYNPYDINTPRIFRECIETILYVNDYKYKWDDVVEYPYQNREILSTETEIIREIIMKDGLIYNDFIIDPNDKNAPKYIIDLQDKYGEIDSKPKVPWIEIEEIFKNIIPQETYDLDETKEKDNHSSYICTRLMAELIFKKDIDGNNLILGKDFVFANYNNENLKCMYCIENTRLCCSFDNLDLPELTWEQFIQTFPGNEPDDRKR